MYLKLNRLSDYYYFVMFVDIQLTWSFAWWLFEAIGSIDNYGVVKTDSWFTLATTWHLARFFGIAHAV